MVAEHVCSLRAVWVLAEDGGVLISRRFPTVERQWRRALDESAVSSPTANPLLPRKSSRGLPGDRVVCASYARALNRVRHAQSAAAAASFDPLGEHVLHLSLPPEEVSKEKIASTDAHEEGESGSENRGGTDEESIMQDALWPVIHVIGRGARVLALPFAHPRHLAHRPPPYHKSTGHTPEGVAVLAELSCVAPAFEMAQTMISLISGTSASPSNSDCDTIREFIAAALPFGTLLDTNATNCLAVRGKGFPSGEVHMPRPQPAWKPHLFAGRPRVVFTVREHVNCAMHKTASPLDVAFASCVLCKAEVEGLPDITVPIVCPALCRLTALAVHPCVQAPDSSECTSTTFCFSPPLGQFEVARFVPSSDSAPVPPITGTYTFKEESTMETSIEIQLHVNERAGGIMEFCEVTLPFLGRGHPSLAKVVASSGAAAVVDHQVVWKLASGFGKRGRTEAQLTGRIQFSAPKCCDVSGDDKFHTALKVTQPTDSQMSKHDMFCHGLTGYARVNFKMIGASLSGISIDKRMVVVFLAGKGAVKTPVECSNEVVSGDFILWNTLGNARMAASVNQTRLDISNS
eukprot:CAMPEP_0114278592 /NCGR_PEP_ID=MMETSP0059-20121206/1422_1 /TAXON_ID=36894 /ORGANISM="Pyramimonas parkeae, Strain CCMP726" /LENGTH=574 /DNA_ID=CAMNT_0001398807 /DNA_START=624 /DNA_END=2348 /DNA_ORIENTATION=+